MSAYWKRNRNISFRKADWDYGREAYYFVTICTKNKFPFFGKREDGKVILTDEGLIADKLWKEIPDHFSYTKLIKHIVMPDHMHGIILIDKTEDSIPDKLDDPFQSIYDNSDFQVETRFIASVANPDEDKDKLDKYFQSDSDIEFQVGTRFIASLLENPGDDQKHSPGRENDKRGGFAGETNPMLHDNLPRIIRWFKGRTTIECRKLNPDFRWQTRFYDRIIRDQNSLNKIKVYIALNPKRSDQDPLDIHLR